MNFFDYVFEHSKGLDKEFIVGGREPLSYAELYRDSSSLASWLQDEFGQGRNILLVSPNSAFFITAYLGILKSGNACVPLNYTIEQGNLEYILEQTESPLVFCQERLKAQYAFGEGVRVLSEADLPGIVAARGDSERSWDLSFPEDRLAEIIFTSGSTGVPKGVMLTHGNLIANTASIVSYLKLTGDDRMCVVLPFFYCYGLSLLHTHLRVGGSLVLNNTFIFLGSVINDLKKHRCTGFAGVPSHFQVLLKKSKSFKETEFPDLRYVTQAGGKLHSVFIRDFIEAFPQIDFFVMYGQTEATARLSYLDPQWLPEKIGSIGKGIPGVDLRVVDPSGNPVPDGQEGELIARGGNIMAGYYKDVEETSKTLKDGWLHTGDLAYRDEDGFFYIVGRQKEIIKVGGKRISPKEIEEVILSVPEVVDCTIRGIEDELLGEALEATIVSDNSLDEEMLRQRILLECSQKLSGFKIPQKFIFLEQMPMSLSGKKIK